MILYYITDRRQFPGTEAEQRRALLDKIGEASRADVDLIQLREKDLSSRVLEELAREAMSIIRGESLHTALLINSRSDLAIAADCDGVHLTSEDIAASDARVIWAAAGIGATIGVSCHSAEEVQSASSHGADFAVLAPVFGKMQTGAPGVGIDALRAATGVASKPDLRVEAGDRRGAIPVLALGGVSLENARECITAGAAGIAGIRLFQEGDIKRTTLRLNVARAPSLASRADARIFPFEYRRRLPHYQGDDRTVFVTFRTADNFVLDESVRGIVLNHCLADHTKRYLLIAAVVMPDHVHAILQPNRDAGGQAYRVAQIMQSLKGASAHSINKLLNRRGPVWQHESFDHVLRSHEKLQATLNYLAMNPVRKGLVTRPEEYLWMWIAKS